MSQHQNSSRTTSFLSLPPDIRVEVYRHLLGQKTLHFNDYFTELGNGGIFLCKASMPDAAVFGKAEGSRAVTLGRDELENCIRMRHQYCYTDWPGLDLQLLLVCKLIYREASLVPFAENTFILQSREMVARLLARLKPWQIAAISNLTLHQQDPWRYWEVLPCMKTVSRTPLLFRNLRRLTVFIELFSSATCVFRPDWNGAEYQDNMIAAMRDVVSRRLEVVDVDIVAFDCGPHTMMGRGIDSRELETWAARTRRMMLEGERLG